MAKSSNNFEYYKTFPIKPEKFKSEKLKKSFNLTLSWLLKNNNNNSLKLKIIKLQKEISDIIVDFKKYPEDGKIYITKESDIHFSIVNFYSLENIINFSTTRVKFEKEYDLFISALKREIKTQLSNINNGSISFRWIYTGKYKNNSEYEKHIPATISLQAYLCNNFRNICSKICDEGSKILTENLLNFKPVVKGYPNNFAINLCRFFIEPNAKTTNLLTNFIERKNKQFDFECLAVQDKIIKLNLIVSDQYLNNSDPVLEEFIIH